MKRNVCGLDRRLRLVVVALLGVLSLRATRRGSERDRRVSGWTLVAGWLAAELLVTGLLQWCPGNYLLGIDTCE